MITKSSVRSGGFTSTLHHDSNGIESTSIAAKKSERKQGNIATWAGDPIFLNTYSTTLNDIPTLTQDPALNLSPGSFDDLRFTMAKRVVPKFDRIIENKYGTVEKLFEVIKKNNSDKISLDEFSQELRKRGLDTHFPREEQRLLFELFDKDHSSTLRVGDLTSYFQRNHNIISDINSHQEAEIKLKLSEKFNHQRMSSKLLLSPRTSKKQLTLSLRNLDPDSTGYLPEEAIRYALGPKYLNLELNEDEISQVIHMCPRSSKNDTIDYYKFVDSLKLSDTSTSKDVVADAYFDSRINQIRRLKQRLNQLDASSTDPVLVARRLELMENIKKSKSNPAPVNSSLVSSYSQNSVCNPQGSLVRNNPMSLAPLENSRLNTSNNSYPVGAKSVHLDTTHPQIAIDHAEREKLDMIHALHFRSTSNPPSMTKLKFPTQVEVRNNSNSMGRKGHHDKGRHAGKRRGPLELTDWSRIGYGGELSTSYSAPSLDSQSSTISEESFSIQSDVYKTTASEYFQPLVYEPSRLPYRPNVVSDAERSALKSKLSRLKKFERTQRNLQSFQDEKECYEISDRLNTAARAKGRVEESLHYELNAMNKDQRTVNKMPLNTMQRKPNPDLFKKMWGGNFEKNTSHTEDRDFSTTYLLSYHTDSSSPVIE